MTDLFLKSYEAHQLRMLMLLDKLESEPQDKYSGRALDMQTKKHHLWVEQEGKCCFCHKLTYLDSAVKDDKSSIATLEHVTCQTHGGTDDLENLKMSCLPCNNARKDYDFDEFKELVDKFGYNNFLLMERIEASLYRRLKIELDDEWRKKRIGILSMLDATKDISGFVKSYKKQGFTEDDIDYVKELIEENRRARNQRDITLSSHAYEAIRPSSTSL